MQSTHNFSTWSRASASRRSGAAAGSFESAWPSAPSASGVLPLWPPRVQAVRRGLMPEANAAPMPLRGAPNYLTWSLYFCGGVPACGSVRRLWCEAPSQSQNRRKIETSNVGETQKRDNRVVPSKTTRWVRRGGGEREKRCQVEALNTRNKYGPNNIATSICIA